MYCNWRDLSYPRSDPLLFIAPLSSPTAATPTCDFIRDTNHLSLYEKKNEVEIASKEEKASHLSHSFPFLGQFRHRILSGSFSLIEAQDSIFFCILYLCNFSTRNSRSARLTPFELNNSCCSMHLIRIDPFLFLPAEDDKNKIDLRPERHQNQIRALSLCGLSARSADWQNLCCRGFAR